MHQGGNTIQVYLFTHNAKIMFTVVLPQMVMFSPNGDVALAARGRPSCPPLFGTGCCVHECSALDFNRAVVRRHAGNFELIGGVSAPVRFIVILN